MRRLALVLALALLLCALAGGATLASTTFDSNLPPPFPQAFYGLATIAGQPAPIGTVVEARGPGVKVGIVANPITTTVVGKYGGPTLGEIKLGVQGWIETGAPITFYLNGEQAQVSDGGRWSNSVAFRPGVVSQVHLRTLKHIIMMFLRPD